MEEPQREEPVSNFWVHNGELRLFWKLSSYFSVFAFIFIVLITPASILLGQLDWRILNPLLILLAGVLATMFALAVTDRRPFFSEIGLRKSGRGGRDLLLGFLIAGGMISLLFLLELLFGGARINSVHLTAAHVSQMLLVSLISFSLVGFAEEILMRGYPFTILCRQGSTSMALLLTSALFSLMHGFNPEIGWLGFANIFLAGLWLGVARVVAGTLWLAIGLHTGWNFFLGSVFGFPVSGIFERSMLITETDGPSILTGGAFGPEGGLLATVVLLLGIGALTLPRVRLFLADRVQPSFPKEEIEESP